MLFTRQLCKRIRQAVHDYHPSRPRIEVGHREYYKDENETTPNAFLWRDDVDLDDAVPLHHLAGEEVGTVGGNIELDLYLYASDGGLIGNEAVLVSERGEVIVIGNRWPSTFSLLEDIQPWWRVSLMSLELDKRRVEHRRAIAAEARDLAGLTDDAPLGVVYDWLLENGREPEAARLKEEASL